MLNKPELLAPATNLQRQIVAYKAGADAIYCGTNKYGLRYNKNFGSIKDLKTMSEYSKSNNKKIFITLNIFMNNINIENLKKDIKEIESIDADAYIVSDPGAFYFLKTNSNKEIHISTQSNITNYNSCKFWTNNGASRAILARELKLSEIYHINKMRNKNNDNFLIETFIHGAMCIAYSGRCLLSLYMTSPELSDTFGKKYRHSNKGMCVHPCRWEYTLKEKERPNEDFDVIEDNNYTYFMSSKDLNMLKHIPLLILSGVDSLKIEGRMKSNLYLFSTVNTYRQAIDYSYNYLNSLKLDTKKIENYINTPELFFKEHPVWLKKYNELKENLNIYSHRPYTTGFYFTQTGYDPELGSGGYEYSAYYRYMGESFTKIEMNNEDINKKFYNIVNQESNISIYAQTYNYDYSKLTDSKIADTNSYKKLKTKYKYAYPFFLKNKYEPNKDSLYIYNSGNLEKLENFDIVDINFEKPEYTKHNEFYYILSDTEFDEYNILLKRK